jgi:hypothetical protein
MRLRLPGAESVSEERAERNDTLRAGTHYSSV